MLGDFGGGPGTLHAGSYSLRFCVLRAVDGWRLEVHLALQCNDFPAKLPRGAFHTALLGNVCARYSTAVVLPRGLSASRRS